MPLPAQLSPILHAVAAAGRLAKATQHALTSDTVKTKTDGSVVTLADYAAQALINHLLTRDALPINAMVCEESAESLSADQPLLHNVVQLLRSHGWPDATSTSVLHAIDLATWSGTTPPDDYYTIDPIDGTKGFAAGRQFAVCFARVQRGQCTLAALACPNLSTSTEDPIAADNPTQYEHGTLFAATADSPVFTGSIDDPAALRPLPLRGSGDIDNPIITFSVEPSEARVRNFDRLATLLGGARRAPADSQAKYAMVARAQADAYFRPPRNARENVWDHAAGCLLLQRAGCLVTDLRGQPLDWSTGSLPARSGILGAPARLHARVLTALANFTPGLPPDQAP